MTENIPPFALNVVTLGVTDFARSVRFYEGLGLTRKMRKTGDEIAVFRRRRRRAHAVPLAHARRGCGAARRAAAHKTFFGGYSGYFADPDGHAWQAVRAPGFSFTGDRRVILPD